VFGFGFCFSVFDAVAAWKRLVRWYYLIGLLAMLCS